MMKQNLKILISLIFQVWLVRNRVASQIVTSEVLSTPGCIQSGAILDGLVTLTSPQENVIDSFQYGYCQPGWILLYPGVVIEETDSFSMVGYKGLCLKSGNINVGRAQSIQSLLEPNEGCDPTSGVFLNPLVIFDTVLSDPNEFRPSPLQPPSMVLDQVKCLKSAVVIDGLVRNLNELTDATNELCPNDRFKLNPGVFDDRNLIFNTTKCIKSGEVVIGRVVPSSELVRLGSNFSDGTICGSAGSSILILQPGTTVDLNDPPVPERKNTKLEDYFRSPYTENQKGIDYDKYRKYTSYHGKYRKKKEMSELWKQMNENTVVAPLFKQVDVYLKRKFNFMF